MAEQRKNRNRQMRAYGMGLPLLLVLYVVLCLVTVSVLSVMTADRTQKLEAKSAELFSQRTEAENEAEERIAELNQTAAKDPDGAPAQQNFTIAISDEKDLEVALEKVMADGSARYRIVKWETVTHHTQEEQTHHGVSLKQE